jgi:hypothetical protein
MKELGDNLLQKNNPGKEMRILAFFWREKSAALLRRKKFTIYNFEIRNSISQ